MAPWWGGQDATLCNGPGVLEFQVWPLSHPSSFYRHPCNLILPSGHNISTLQMRKLRLKVPKVVSDSTRIQTLQPRLGRAQLHTRCVEGLGQLPEGGLAGTRLEAVSMFLVREEGPDQGVV